jgi:flavin reductase (DIM6/NTAB) family NADH-FMN oxidoreductase RutF
MINEKGFPMEAHASDLPHREIYKLLTGCVVPRPIAWVSSLNAEGQPNLAPFSFFNAVCSNPPTLMFVTSVRGTDGGQKDTYHNVQATGEFVVNFVTESLAEQMNITSTEFPADVNEFESAGLTPAPSVLVKPPRVAESPVHFECKLNQIVTIGNEIGGGHIVIGTIVHIHCDESVYRGNNYIDIQAYQPVGRLAGGAYSRTRDVFEIRRPESQIPPIKK